MFQTTFVNLPKDDVPFRNHGRREIKSPLPLDTIARMYTNFPKTLRGVLIF
jgi:hypothetical protein